MRTLLIDEAQSNLIKSFCDEIGRMYQQANIPTDRVITLSTSRSLTVTWSDADWSLPHSYGLSCSKNGGNDVTFRALTDWKVLRVIRKGMPLTEEEQAASDIVYTQSAIVENEIMELTSIDDVILFENYPIDKERLVVDEKGLPLVDEHGELTNETESVTMYINKVKEW